MRRPVPSTDPRPVDLRAAGAAVVARAVSHELRRLEEAEGARVLLAVESGSRAWGFESPDSDFDVRFVYVRPLEHYLRLEGARDVLEWRLDEVLDISGWDLDKSLRLARGANPSFFEWLASPIVYAEDPAFTAVRDLAADCFSPVASARHYLSMARGQVAACTAGTIRLKKYLYIMRVLLAARWVVAERAPAPMLFGDLVGAELEGSMSGLVEGLLAAKTASGESDERPRVPAFDAWVAGALAELEDAVGALAPGPKVPWGRLNEVFLAIVRG